MKSVRIIIFILIAFLLFWFIYFLKTGDLFFKDSYFTKERAYQAWVNDNRQTGLTKEFLENAKKIEPTDKQLLILAGKNKIYQLRFPKEFFLWRYPSVYRIDNESLKIMKENDIEYDLSFNCVATAITKNPNIIKVKIGEKEAHLLSLAPYFNEAKNLKMWFLNIQPDAWDCQGPSGKTYTFYNNSGKVIKKIEDN
ncbi:hypothetical protein BIV60_05630 [Bacillus sp. MUM 116]|uniref:hypothetical protein n=1 Tax=Bacillus sp. MUM 116 TaxID=1678002 RepID=UPI0008F568A4|nr:hypothetical protein [Bacillus sp. MUM 116]OIK16254.1 hypothetical protein BIV60_05630 [Bacillus sp. MUM 116]